MFPLKTYKREKVNTTIEKSNVDVLRKVIRRQAYEQTTPALEDPCAIYDIVSQTVFPFSL